MDGEPESAPATPANNRRRRALTCCAVLVLAFPCIAFFTVRGILSRYEAEAAAVLQGLEDDGLGVSDAALGRPSEPFVPVPQFPEFDRMFELLNFGLWRVSPNDALLLLRDPTNELVMWDPNPGQPEDPLVAFEAAFAHLETFWPRVSEALDRRAFAPSDWELSYVGRRGDLDVLVQVQAALQFRAAYFTYHGQPERAWAETVRMLRFVADFERGTLIEYLIRCAHAGIAAHSVVGQLQVCSPPSEEVAAELDRLLTNLEDPDALTHAIQRDCKRLFAFIGPGTSNEELAEHFEVSPYVVSFYVAAHRPGLARTYAELIRASRLDPEDAIAAFAQAETRYEADKRDVVQSRAGILSTTHRTQLNTVAILRMARIALRLAREETLPTALPADSPTDPWSGERELLRYRRTSPSTATLWSIGQDQLDQGMPPPREELLDVADWDSVEDQRAYIKLVR